MAPNKEGAESRVMLIKGRRWAHLRIEALQDNSPRYHVRRASSHAPPARIPI